jgi:hypothetical protein
MIGVGRGCSAAVVLSALLSVFPGCDCDGAATATDPCAGIDCSGHGECVPLPFALGAYCACESGYHPADRGRVCVPNDTTNPCAGVDCGGHGYCGASPAGLPVCVCFPGYHVDDSGLWCIPDAPPPDGGGDADAGEEDTGPESGSDSGADADEYVPPPWWRDEWTREPGPTRVDILVVVESSESMAQEQLMLTLRFPELIYQLVAPSDSDGDGRPDQPPVEDLNLGVISPDMGTGGFTGWSLRGDPVRGQDGCMLHEPSPDVPGCETSYPTFLSRNETNAATYTAAQVAQDFTCIATLGIEGCNWEQPLKAALKAVRENNGPGGCNEGFLRHDSVLAVIIVTDENDASVDPAHPELFDTTRTEFGELNLRAFLHPEMLVPIEDFVAGFQRLLPGRLGPIIFGMIIGIPPDAADCIGSGDEIDGCLDQPAMQEQIDPELPTQLIPSCNTSMGLAFPPRRLVEFAQKLGKGGFFAYVDSICKSEWTDAIHGITNAGIQDNLHDDQVYLDPAAPFDPATCMAGCFLLERLNDGRACLADESCPPAWCPPARPETVNVMEPCRDPATGAVCTPIERDLGTEGSPEFERRWCLIRQAPRNPFDACGPGDDADAAGWTCITVSWDDPGECSELVFFHPGLDELIDTETSTAILRCWNTD